jgi:hypothetical protein
MAIRTSIFDRISEQRIAAEARAREEAERALAEAQAAALLPVEIPVTAMDDSPARFDLRGFQFVLPPGAHVRDMQLQLEHEGETIELAIRRRKVAEMQTLGSLFADEVDALEQRHAQWRIVRRREALLAGSKALALDYQFSQGHDRRHGRIVAGLIPQTCGSAPQWFSISCVIDPDIEALCDWLVQFDHMLDGLAGA